MITEWDFTYYSKRPGQVRSCKESEIFDRNNEELDIFWTPQVFPEGDRVKESLITIRCICADFDDITHEEFYSRFRYLPEPSLVVKTRSGFHAYWALKTHIPGSEGASEAYKKFVEQKLLDLGADENAKDVSRILRTPHMRYWYDSKNNCYRERKIFISVEHETANTYSWEALEKYFPTAGVPAFEVIKPKFFTGHTSVDGNDFWARANKIPVLDALKKLSGSPYVNGERYEFKKDPEGIRIHIDGVRRNAWIDRNGLIGSMKRKGPAIPNWLHFHQSGATEQERWNKVAKILKEVFKI